ncbi:MAG TPA: efflux RND transporter periplasmic adaptor subunit [Shinella sp.]|jgi:HlyD family secretion protein|uniref:efflux RND transporter periplasmic adaptor subunit n=1 Tax=Shinella sp. TaxID=1870904 RepID=UPI002E1633DD|nr:efflux RND transporter periplasmic adaptor subunit [Shinella sp.]
MKRIVIIVLVLAFAAGGGWWWHKQAGEGPAALALYGNVDFRQVTLAFNGNGPVAEVFVEEGAEVKQGQVIGQLDTSRIVPQIDQAEAQVAARQATLTRLKNGNRPEEIAQARANLAAADAEAANARLQLERQIALVPRAAVSQQALDNARSNSAVAEAKVMASQKALDLLVAGTRIEEVQGAAAELRAAEAQVALLRAQLADTELKAPVDAVVRSRLIEPGEMASPTRAAFSLATISPKWVRAYVSEAQLGLIRMGMKADVRVDSFPGRPFAGWIGFVSSVAEFTPKTVQTEDLRTSLVFEVRVFVEDPDNGLRLGMPATVTPLVDGGQQAGG